MGAVTTGVEHQTGAGLLGGLDFEPIGTIAAGTEILIIQEASATGDAHAPKTNVLALGEAIDEGSFLLGIGGGHIGVGFPGDIVRGQVGCIQKGMLVTGALVNVHHLVVETH